MKKLFMYGWVVFLLMHHFFVFGFAFAGSYTTLIQEDDVFYDPQETDQYPTQEYVNLSDQSDDISDNVGDDDTQEQLALPDDQEEQGYPEVVTEDMPQDPTHQPQGEEDQEQDYSDIDEFIDDEMIDQEYDNDEESTEDDAVYIPDEEAQQALPPVLITEVYFAGINERFELYNPHDEDFIGTLEIEGVRSSLLTLENITIPAKTARVISRSQGLDLMVDTSVVDSVHALSMPNANPIHITVSLDGEVIDTFVAPQSLMNQANISTTDRASLQRTLDDISVIHVSPIHQNYNTSDPDRYKINPGIVYYSIADLPPAACEQYGQIVQIREIFWGDDDRDPYIELFIPGQMTEQLTIDGSILEEHITISIDQPAGHYHLISIPGNSYTQQPFVSDNQELSFRSELGNLVVYGQGGQVLDKVDITVRESGYSSYVSGQGCQRVANQVDVYSPGFPRSYLSYFPDGVEKVVTVVETITIPAEPVQCEQEQDDSGETTPIPETTPRTGTPITITHVDYAGPVTDKSITLWMTGSDAIDMSDFHILTNGSNRRNLRGILEPDIPMTLTGSLGFAATQARCVELFHNDHPESSIDTYCYDPIEDTKRQGEIKITNIIYDTAPGSNIRQLHLYVPEGVVDLSHDRYIIINTTRRNLTSYGNISGHVILEGTFPFPKTRETCVEIRQYDVLFDTYCYDPPQSTTNTNQPTTTFDDQRLNYPINITHIHYAGPTTGKSITFFMTGGSTVDMSHFHILINGTTRRNLRGTLEPNTPLTITGSLGFAATQARCVELFHKEHLFHTYCYDPAEDRAREQAARVWTGDIIISDIRYETDENHPDQSLTLSTTGADIVFAHGRYLMINSRRFSLTSFGTGGGDMTLTGNFRFPRTVASCITIGQYDTEFTTHCYDPRGQTSQTEKVVYSGVRLEILAAFPNAIGPDAGKEWIDLMLHTPDEVDFSQGFAILINGRTRRSISGNPVAGEVYRLTGTFVLPNAASCFSILYHDDVLDSFCYPQTQQGMIYRQNAEALLALTESELSLLNATRLTRFDNRLCLTLSDVTIRCRAIPAGRLAARQMEELRLSRNYINTLHDYLYNHRQIIYFNTDIVHYKRLFDQSKREISNSQFTRRYGSEHIPVSDIQTRFQLQYQQPLLQTVQSQVSNSLFGPKLAQNYQKAKEKWYSQ